MHEYRKSQIARLMQKVNAKVNDIDLFVADTMLRMTGIEPILGGGSLVGRSLILGTGQSPLACALGSRDFGHEVVGICFHAANVPQQNFMRNKLRSRARFTYSTVKDLLLVMPVGNWGYIFVLPAVNWNDISDFVLSKMHEDSQIIVAQKMPTVVLLENFEHQGFRVTQAGYCHEAELSGSEYVIFKIR